MTQNWQLLAKVSPTKQRNSTYHGLNLSIGIGRHVKNTVSSRNDFLPQTSDNAPIRGALRNDSRPWKADGIDHFSYYSIINTSNTNYQCQQIPSL